MGDVLPGRRRCHQAFQGWQGLAGAPGHGEHQEAKVARDVFSEYEFELGHAARVLCEEVLGLKPGETIVMTCDTESDARVIMATGRAALELGAKPVVLLTASPLGVGKAADTMLPVDVLSGCLKETDVWVEFNNKWLLYSTPYERVMEANQRIRYMCLVGMNVDMMVRTIGRVDHKLLREFMERIRAMTKAARKMRVTTPAGTDVEFENVPGNPMSCDMGSAGVPGVHFLSGQIGWCPDFSSINGRIVFDGSISPPVGKVSQPVVLHVRGGRVERIEGGAEAQEFLAWLKALEDDNMFRLAHICYGFNPNARLTGNVLEDERVWGCTEWGMGYQSAEDAPPDGIMAKSHTDGICLNSSVWLDGVQLLDKGEVVHPEVAPLAWAVLGRGQ
jgi:leucyl aminopeptidase (aminopeptidase T)